MDIDVKKLLSSKLTPNDILINEFNTYPENLKKQMRCKEFCEDDFKNYFYEKTHYNVVGVHFTRLFDYEISNIKTYGLHSDDSTDYYSKIQRLPSEFDDYKRELIAFVEAPFHKRSHGKIYFDVGKIDIYFGNSVFLKNWGGETLYCYYDSLKYKDKDLLLANRLRKQTIPCVVIVKVNAYQFFAEFKNNEGLIESIQNNDLLNYKNEVSIDKDEVSVIDVIPVKYLKQNNNAS